MIIDINTFISVLTQFYFVPYLFIASTIMGIMLCIRKIIIRK